VRVTLDSGRVRDLRNGTMRGGHQKIQTCITVAAGDCVLDV
jgi:stearoyl-CoA 9-desaturase NADPH oxidoreductase